MHTPHLRIHGEGALEGIAGNCMCVGGCTYACDGEWRFIKLLSLLTNLCNTSWKVYAARLLCFSSILWGVNYTFQMDPGKPCLPSVRKVWKLVSEVASWPSCRSSFNVWHGYKFMCIGEINRTLSWILKACSFLFKQFFPLFSIL